MCAEIKFSKGQKLAEEFAKTIRPPLTREQLSKLDSALAWIVYIIQRNRTPNVPELVAIGDRQRAEQIAAIEHVEAAAEYLGPQSVDLWKIANKMRAEMFEPFPVLGKRGPKSWQSYCVRELDALIPKDAINRSAAIARLLKLAGVDVDRRYVNSLLKGGKT